METLDILLGSLRRCCGSLPDKRTGANGRYGMADIGVAAFSVFFMQSPSFLAHQRALQERRSRSNCQTLFCMDRIPTDNHIRKMLDPVSPDHLFPLFSDALGMLSERGGLAAFRRLDGRLLIALDAPSISPARS